jgi:shikimate kinase
MMGVGKTTTGQLLADRLGWRFLDSDAEIIRRTGRTVPEIFATDGEAAFRAQESAVLAEAVAPASDRVVVAVAGGAVLDEGNRALLRDGGLVVWLRASVPTMVERVGTGEGRPLLDEGPEKVVPELYERRRPVYESLAEVVVDVDGRSPAEVVDEVLASDLARQMLSGESL